MFKVTKNVVFLDRGNYTTCTIHLHGATITSYRVRNKEILYMKKKTVFNNISPIRGGIKVAFPYMPRRNGGPKYGFSRYMIWRLESGPTILDNGNIEAVFSLEDNEYSRSHWNFKFKLTLKITLCLSRLLISIKVENTSPYFPFLFTLIRLSIFQVQDVRNIEIKGLSQCSFLTYNSHSMSPTTVIKNPKASENKMLVNSSLLNVYLKVPPVIEVLNIDNKGLKLRLIVCDKNSEDVVLSNPWSEDDGVPNESQHFKNEYLNFISISNGYLHKELRLEPQESWEVHHIIEVIDEEYEKKIEKLESLLSNPLELFKEKCDTSTPQPFYNLNKPSK